jgi:hypothetical protein
MSEINETKNVRDDEIDLLDLFRRMGRTLGRWANALGTAVLISIVFLLRRWLPLTVSLILGIGVSYLMKRASESYYTSDLILKTNATSTDEMIAYINRLHTFCSEGNKEALASSIHLSPEQIKYIGDISAFWIIDQGNDKIPDYVDFYNRHDIYDTVNVRMQDRLNVRVRIKVPQELTRVKEGIIQFINDDQLFQQKNDVRLKHNEEMLARLTFDIHQLDSLQQYKYFQETRNLKPQQGGSFIFLQEQKTQLLYTDIHTLYARKQSLETDNELYKDIVTVLSEFTIPASRDNGGLYYAKTIVPVFFFLTLIVLIMIANKRKLLEVYNKY